VSVDSGEPFEIEYRLRRADGAWRWHLARSSPVRAQGRVVRWFGTCTDIDDQKRAQEEIQLARARAEHSAIAASHRAAELDAFLDAIADGLVLSDEAGRVVRTNTAAQRILGYGAEDLALGSLARLARLRPVWPDGQPAPLEALPPVRAMRGELVRNEELRFQRRDGGIRWVTVSSAPIRSDTGQLHRVVTTFSDVTTAHELQDQREDLLRAISHDLRTPLTVIVAQAQMLARKPDDPVAALRRAESIRTSAGRMATMIEDLVDLVRLEAGQVKVEPRPVPLGPFVAELRDRLRGAIAVERLRLEVPDSLPPAMADPPMLERILVNLITNALKYSPPETEVLLSATEVGVAGTIRITMADRGSGIAPEELPRIFDRFYRSPSATRKEGLGLGLYITRLLVEAHRGTIHVESDFGKGSAFHVDLPAG
jgi:PAS domain S-box-containing protein